MHRRTFLTSTAALAVAGLTTAPAYSATITRARPTRATTLDQLRSQIASAGPGAFITLADGTYDVPADRPLAVNSRHGTAEAPITIAAEHRGRAVLTGQRGFTFADSSYVTVNGFVFRQRTTLELPLGCHHLRLTRNDVQLTDSDGLNWLLVKADHSKLDRNHFHGKATLGVFVGVEGPGGDGMARGLHLLRNYFSDHTFTGANGGEPIRLGLSGRSLADAGAVVEQNLFERANGDPEAISVKSSGNTIRNNTIRNSLGGIVLRHGNRSRVEGNFILAGSNGIRIWCPVSGVARNDSGVQVRASRCLSSGLDAEHRGRWASAARCVPGRR